MSQLRINDFLQRLHTIAYQNELYSNTMSQEKTINMLLDEIQEKSTHLMSVDGIELYNQKIDDYFLLIQKMWQQFYEIYQIEDLEKFVQNIGLDQDDASLPEWNHNDIQTQKKLELLEQKNIRIREASPSDVSLIKAMLGDYSSQFYEAWTVENISTKKALLKYLKLSGTNRTQLLWHGSRNENWWSILNSGLSVQPQDVIITGKMFGNSIYFAPVAEKSMYFTSIKMPNSKRKFSNTSLIGLFDVAYENPYHVSIYDPKYADFDFQLLQKEKEGADCLYAHKGELLQNEEIIVYKNEQTTIRYLVELRKHETLHEVF